MSAVDLLILGLVKNQSMSAYDMAGLSGIFELVKISQPAIYRNVKKLEQKGFLAGTQHKVGNMPEKRVYSITAAGKRKIHALMKEIADQKPGFFIDFNVCILLLEQLPKAQGLELLTRLRKNLQANLEHLTEQSRLHGGLSLPIRALAEQHIKLNQILYDWLAGFIKEYSKLS